jgi:hypothetical protein
VSLWGFILVFARGFGVWQAPQARRRLRAGVLVWPCAKNLMFFGFWPYVASGSSYIFIALLQLLAAGLELKASAVPESY